MFESKNCERCLKLTLNFPRYFLIAGLIEGDPL